MIEKQIKVLLVESHYRTRSWFEAMKDIGELFVLSVLPEERELFSRGGVAGDKILNFHNPCIEDIELEDAIEYLRNLEREMKFSFNEIVRMDRTLRLKSHDYIAKYLYFITRNIVKFLEEKRINIVFLEPTWTHEIILCNICRHMDVPILAPVKDKVLPNRFFMFHGYLRNVPFVRLKDKSSGVETESVISLVNKGEKPQYFDKFSGRNRLNFDKFRVLYRITRLAVLGLANKNIQPKLHISILKKIAAISRVQFFTYFNKFSRLSDVSLPYILVTLHVQPEAGIDVVGAKFSDQLHFIRQISRTTPIGYYVLVKEHPHDFGRRGAHFYNELHRMSNVLILGPDENSSNAIKGANLVVSTAGTSSFEAALMGVPAVTAVEMYFKDLMVVESFDPNIDQISTLLTQAEVWKKSFSNEESIRILNKVQENVFIGNPGDCMVDPNVLSKENIKNLRKAFLEVVATYGAKSNPRLT